MGQVSTIMAQCKNWPHLHSTESTVTFWRIFSYLNQPRTQLTSIFWRSTLQKKALFNQNKGHVGSRNGLISISRPPQKKQPNDIRNFTELHRTPRTSHGLRLGWCFHNGHLASLRKRRKWCFFFVGIERDGPDDLFSFKGVGRIDSSFTPSKVFWEESYSWIQARKKKSHKLTLSPNNHGSGKWLYSKGKYYWREPLFTSMSMGGRVVVRMT